MPLKSAQSSDGQTLGVYMDTSSGSDGTEATDVGWHTLRTLPPLYTALDCATGP